MIYISSTKAYKELTARKSKNQVKIDSYMTKLEILETYLIDEYKKIDNYFSGYTRHDWNHTINVLNYMYDLVERPEQLSEEDFMIMIFVALFHDIGMALDESEANEFIQREVSDKEDKTRIIRAKHGEFAEKKLEKIVEKAGIGNNEQYIKLRDAFKLCHNGSNIEMDNTIRMVAAICNSHTRPIHWIHQKWRSRDEAIYFACLLRLADLLDVDSNRTKTFQSLSNTEEYIHKLFNSIISDVDKIKKEAETCHADCPNRKNKKPCNKCYKKIVLEFEVPFDLDNSEKAIVRQMINSYKIEIESEILDVIGILENMNEKYQIKLISNVYCEEIENQAVDALQVNSHRLTVDYSAIRSIMFEKEFYRNKLHGIREVIQNAYDACKAFAELKADERSWVPKITIIFHKTDNTITIHDNGVGMTDFVIKEYFLNFGRSIYNFETEYLYDDFYKEHIGHFGIGFFAAFMLSSKVVVNTQSKDSRSSINIVLDKNNDFAILTYNCGNIGHGTEIILDFKEVKEALMVEDADKCAFLIMQYIKETFLYDGISIYGMGENGEEIKIEPMYINAVNSISKYLAEINAIADICKKEFPPIFYATDSECLEKKAYEELLIELAKYKKESGKIYYLDAGNFLIFTGNNEIENDFMNHAMDINPRRNYSYGVYLSDSIKIKNNEFCDKMNIAKPQFCEYRCLDLVVNGSSAALSEINMVCARKKNIMWYNDACGEAPRDDKIYIRDVLVPALHICLPSLNFRYDLKGFVANIKTDNVFPTIMRDTLTDERAKELSYAVGAAITKFEIENGVDIAENTLIFNNLYNKSRENIFIKGGH